MIESETLPSDAVAYLNSIEEHKNRAAQQLGRAGARSELLAWCNQWFATARTWRKQSYEDDWLAWQRNADGRYDPRLAAKKKDWQAKGFVDLTPSHRETIHAELFRLVAGSRPILDVTPRPGGDPVQAENIRDLELREFEKSRFEVEYNKILEDKDTYGSGFCRLWYETLYQDRVVKVPVQEPLVNSWGVPNPAAIARSMGGQRQVVGYHSQTQKKLVYRGVRIQHVSTWDVFPDPKALKVKGHPHLIRSWINLQFILDQVAAGEFMPESAMLMREQASTEVQPADKQLLQMERNIADVAPRREGNQRTWEAYEIFARIPQKWVYPLLKEPLPLDNAEKLVPARIFFNQQTVFAVYLNQDYEGEPPILKDDYFPVTERYYGRGVPEMLKNPQMIVNEVVNQRLDEGNLALQQGFAVVEKALVNPEDLISGGPGLIVRLRQKELGPNGDVRNGIFPLERPDVKINAGFTEVHEWERMAQERTSANRVTLGNTERYMGGQRTLGGQQLLKQTAGEKFAFIAMLSEFTFMYQVFRMFWQLIYANLTPEDVVAALGQERAQTFQLLSPEDIENGYRFEPKGIFEREAKAEKQGRLAALRDQFKGAPWLNDMANFDAQCKSFDIDPANLKVPQAQAVAIQQMAQQMAQPMARQMVAEIVIGQAVKDVERNLAEKMADTADNAKPELVAKVPDLASPTTPKGSI